MISGSETDFPDDSNLLEYECPYSNGISEARTLARFDCQNNGSKKKIRISRSRFFSHFDRNKLISTATWWLCFIFQCPEDHSTFKTTLSRKLAKWSLCLFVRVVQPTWPSWLLCNAITDRKWCEFDFRQLLQHAAALSLSRVLNSKMIVHVDRVASGFFLKTVSSW